MDQTPAPLDESAAPPALVADPERLPPLGAYLVLCHEVVPCRFPCSICGTHGKQP
ncbi:hypothetical protein [Streptomyces sp. GSL17-111]|uniref:hypothetical protein n=1 Tax=Streptomyces sp. GSL17-111 TaxID=3121596 RepID=UPI0030F3E81C